MLCEQMLQHVLPADIEDDGELGLHSHDVREILIRPHAEIHAAGFCLLQAFEDILERRLIRDEVIGAKIAARLG